MKFNNISYCNNLSFKQGQWVRQPITIANTSANGFPQQHELRGNQQIISCSKDEDIKLLESIASRVNYIQRRETDPVDTIAQIGFTPTACDRPELNHYFEQSGETCRDQSAAYSLRIGDTSVGVRTNQLVVLDKDKIKSRPFGDMNVQVYFPPVAQEITPSSTRLIQQTYDSSVSPGNDIQESSGYLPELGSVLSSFSDRYVQAYNHYANLEPDNMPDPANTISVFSEAIAAPAKALDRNTQLLDNLLQQAPITPVQDKDRQNILLSQQQQLNQQYRTLQLPDSNYFSKHQISKVDR